MILLLSNKHNPDTVLFIFKLTHSILRRSCSAKDINDGHAINMQSPIETNRTPAGVGLGCEVNS